MFGTLSLCLLSGLILKTEFLLGEFHGQVPPDPTPDKRGNRTLGLNVR